MPDVPPSRKPTRLLVEGRRVDPPQDRLRGSDLVGPHDHELVLDGEDAVAGEHRQQRVFGEERPREVHEVGDRVIGGVGPPRRELEGLGGSGLDLAPARLVLSDLGQAHGVGVVLGVGAVRDDEDLHVAEEPSPRPEGVALVAADLVEGVADGDSAPFEFDVDQGQSVDQDRHVVAVRARGGCGLVLVDDLQRVAVHVLFVNKVDVLRLTVVADQALDMVLLDAPRLFDDAVARGPDGRLEEPLPLVIAEPVVVEVLEAGPQVRGERRFVGDPHVLVGLRPQLSDEGRLQFGFALVRVALTGRGLVEAHHGGVVGEDDGLDDRVVGFGGHPGTFLLAWFDWNDGNPGRARLRQPPLRRPTVTGHRTSRALA